MSGEPAEARLSSIGSLTFAPGGALRSTTDWRSELAADRTAEQRPSHEYLESTRWSTASQFEETVIRFYTDEQELARYVVWHHVAGEQVAIVGTGTYHVSEAAILMLPNEDRQYTFPFSGHASDPVEAWAVRHEARIWSDESTLRFGEYLRIEEGSGGFLTTARYYNVSTEVQKGDETIFEGVPVTMMLRDGRTTDDVRVRYGPSTSHNPFPLTRFGGQTVLPKGTYIYVVARTLDKEDIGSWHNYWYLTNIRADDDHYLTPEHGLSLKKWVFAEFVEPE